MYSVQSLHRLLLRCSNFLINYYKLLKGPGFFITIFIEIVFIVLSDRGADIYQLLLFK